MKLFSSLPDERFSIVFKKGKQRDMLYLFIFFSSLIITIFSTPFLINLLTRYNIVDIPGGRRINTSVIPRMGGILIYGIIIAAISAYLRNNPLYIFVLISSGILALCGIFDDLKDLKWYIKYILHSLSAMVIIWYLYPFLYSVEIFGTFLPFPLDIIILFLFITGSVNALNMLDGMDGLVSGFALLLFMMIFILAFSISEPFLLILSAASIGSLIGFLKFNANPAKIFLGDTGSLILGFFLVISALVLSFQFNSGHLDLGFPVILLGVPLIDTLRVIAVRIWNGRNPFEADNSHIHHMISGNNIRHKTTVFIIQVFTVFYILLAVLYLLYDQFLAYMLFCFSGIFLFLLNHIIYNLRKALRLRDFLFRLMPEELFTVDLYKKYLLPFSALTVAGILFVLFPSDASIPSDIVVIMLLICGLLFAASFINRRRYRSYNHIYILFNLLLFFTIKGFALPASFIPAESGKVLMVFSAAGLAGIIALFFLVRNTIFTAEKSILSGVDMIMLSVLIMLKIINNFVSTPGIDFIGSNMIFAFAIYIWCKILMIFKPGLTQPVYYLTFALVLGTILMHAF